MKKFTIGFLILSCNVYAEVSDKMPTQQEIWLTGIIVSFVFIILLRWAKWINILAIPLTILFFYFAFDTLTQPDIGPAIVKEQGKTYILALYGSTTSVLLSVIVGNILNRKRKCKKV